MKGVLSGIVVDRIIRDEEYTMPSVHFHPEYEIYFLLDGARNFFIDGKTYPLKKGCLALVNSEQIHKTSALGRAAHDRFVAEFGGEPFGAFFSALCGTPLEDVYSSCLGVWALDEKQQHTVREIFFTIADEFKEQKAFFQTYVMMKLAELVLFASRLDADRRVSASPPQMWKYTQISTITEYIAGNFNRSISHDELCRHFYISKSYLCGTFKEITGSTVQEYIHICRIKKARELLENTTLSIAEISKSLGYGTATHFERMFRRFMETSPLKYRKKMQLIQNTVRERKGERLAVDSK